MTDLDSVDRGICRALALDAGVSAEELGRRFGLSQPAAWRRVKRLEEAGILSGRRVEVDRAALGFGVTVLEGACRAIDLNGSRDKARGQMQAAGVILAQ